MKKLHFGLMLAVAGFIAGCQQESFREVERYTIEQFMNTTSIRGSSFSPDGERILFTSDQSGVFNAYSIPVDGGAPTQITRSDSNSIYSVSYFPADERILYMSDKGGNEIWHIYMIDEAGNSRDLTPAPEARSTFAGWSFDKQSFFYNSNQRDRRYMDLYEMRIEDFSTELIYQNDEGYSLGSISNDKRYLAFNKTITRDNSDMYLYDRNNREMKHLSAHEGDINYFPVSFSNDNAVLYFLTDEGSEFTYLKKYDIASGATEVVEKTNWDIMYSYFSRNETYRVTGINNDSKTDIKIYKTGTGEQVKLPRLPDADITSLNISDDEKRMTFYVNGSRSPNNLYVYDFSSGKYTKLTESMNPEIAPEDLVEGEVIRYKSFDGLEIPSILYKPHLKPGDKAPALVWVHGGPGGQSRIGYNPLIQYLVNHGYTVLAVNNRGSSGYGKTFFQLDDRKHGQDDLADCVQAKTFLKETGYVDEDKIGIIGGSYGGYMVLAALAFQPDAFSLGVDIFGVANWLRTLQSIPPWWEAYREALYKEMGNPETDEAYLRSISPLFHAGQISKPLLVLQGANDPRVLKVESDEIVEAVRQNNVPVEYIVFDDEGHGFSKKNNRITGYKAILTFLDQHFGREAGLEIEKDKQ